MESTSSIPPLVRSSTRESLKSPHAAPAADPELQIRYRTLTFQHEPAQKEATLKSTQSDPAQAIREINVHLLRTNDVLTKYSTHPTLGLEDPVVKRKLATGKRNRISPVPTNYIKKTLEYIFGGFNFMLWVAGIVILLSWEPLGEPAPQIINLQISILIFVIIFVSAMFYAFVDWNASRIMKSIKGLMAQTASVIRNGVRVEIPAEQVVVGDIVVLSLGERVPADVRLIEMSPDLKFDRSLMTGESDPIAAAIDPTDTNPLQTRNLALSSTFVVQGNGKGVVFATGDDTVMGRIVAMSGKQKTQQTTLQRELTIFTVIISIVAASMFAVAMIVWALWLRVDYPGYMNLSQALLNAIGCLTAFVPEGLPVCMALSLTVIARRMSARKVLVKNLATIETLGCMSVLCTDKTGTLTTSVMSVESVAFFDTEFASSDKRNAAEQIISQPAAKELHVATVMCNGASFDPTTLARPIADRIVKGDATDTAILRFGEHLGAGATVMAKYTKLFEIPFNSKNKWMLSIVQEPGSAMATLLVKGAPDMMLRSCTRATAADGSIVAFAADGLALARVRRIQESWSAQGQRVIAVCRREIPVANLPAEDQLETYCYSTIHDLTLTALLGIRDPPRPDVRQSVEQMHQAGVRVFMVTGDFRLTAMAIARQVSIVTAERIESIEDVRKDKERLDRFATTAMHDMKPDTDNHAPRAIAISGDEILSMNDQEWNVVLGDYAQIVFARTTPEQKLRIVEETRKRGDNTVAVTGDGVNDGPALKASDIGVAMGAGSDVAKEAAAMVLLNNDFSSILVAIENGRLVFENLKKVILYLMPVGSYAEFMCVAINFYLGTQIPLSSYLQVIFCVTHDIVMSVALMYEKAESDLMRRKPRNARTDRLTDWRFFVQIYLFIGLMAWPSCMFVFFNYFSRQGLGFYDVFMTFDRWGVLGATSPDVVDPAVLAGWLAAAQCCYSACQVGLQLFIYLAIRNRRTSILESNPFFGKGFNPVVYLTFPLTYAIAVCNYYGPGIQSVFGTAPIPVIYWFIPWGFGLAILVMDEIRKLIVRTYPKSFVAKIAW
ncbi:hypothetical protein HK105_203184 [Polyrhizophydium stewartii]|uniref:Cation-transporting P-type ATPase N-terminal domain-containing protein n=1 Tax=Polyrhizophydium stewartii TaxID=2732419 RepID=A0ABR4NC52_9FUNG|nr:hypothetical protein HK105_001505 [Polyrhizophydium stewartii]